MMKPEYFTLIQIDYFAGRSIETKRILYQSIIKNLSILDMLDNPIKILIREIFTENWGYMEDKLLVM
ncbi:tautomerase family protein [Acinetobacter baumannii]|uniref:tautomerase family protein n=2 Tax=Acinetobacter baumannii TaxID=470 RepID=UPI002A1967B9|nr:tautomerase family protein [Acinetobacter baumannii]